MAYPKEEAKTFAFKVYVELSNWKSDKREGSGTVLCVGAWNVDGKDMKPAVEKRDYWSDETGATKYGKSRGLNARDFEVILENAYGIAAALGLPKAMVDEKFADRAVAPDAHLEAAAEGNTPF